jgi:N6-adenosine-specific RNA methylase IME4
MADVHVPADDNAVLFCWATSPKLQDCFELLEAWGFTYRTCMVWVKDRIGMGYYARQQHELLLIATRGSLPVPDPADRPSSVFHGRREEHSVKPAIAHELIETMYPHYRRCELFARAPREGWAAWGNQAGDAA